MKGPLIARGRTAELFAWGDAQVLKLLHDWCPTHWVSHEVEVGRRLATTNLPLPRVLAVIGVGGQRGILYERVDGPSMLDLIARRPWLASRMAALLAELHVAIHARPGHGFPRLKEGLEREIGRAADLSPVQKERIVAKLRRLPDGGALCHSDFHPGQVLLSPRGPVVIDWLTAQCGPPPADVARTLLLFAVGAAPEPSRLKRAVIDATRALFRRRYLQRYLELSPGVTLAQIEAWRLPVMAARLAEAIPEERARLLAAIEEALG